MKRYLAARATAIEALRQPNLTAAERSAKLKAAGELLSQSIAPEDQGIEAETRRGYAQALLALGELERWDAETLSAGMDADRFQRAAARRARMAASGLVRDEALMAPLHGVLVAIESIAEPDERHPVRAALLAVPLPIPLIPPRSRTTAPIEQTPAAREPVPRGAIITSVDGSPVTATHVVAPHKVHQLHVEARVLDWPDGADELVLRYVSRWPRTAAEVTDILIRRPAEQVEGVWAGSGEGHLILHAGAADPLSTVRFAINGAFGVGEDSTPFRVIGYDELAVRTFDALQDVITGAQTLDARILAMLAELRDARFAPDEQPAFGRLLGAVAKAAVRIIADRQFPEGSNPTEKEFQTELVKRLAMVSELEGRIVEHAWQGGGPTDISHDGIVAELKVSRTRPVTLANARDFIDQTTQYASADQRQLSILVVLDMTRKDAPPGVLSNTIGWLAPKLHALDEPDHPSRTAVVVVNGNLPVPSAWSR